MAKLAGVAGVLANCSGVQFFLNVHNIKKFSLEQIMEVQTGSRGMVMLFL